MLRKTRNLGLGLAGMSLVAALMLSGAAVAQEVRAPEAGVPDMGVPDSGLPEDGIIVIDDGLIDPICLACMGEGVDGDAGWIDGNTDDGGTDDGLVDDGSDAGDGSDVGIIVIDDGEITWWDDGVGVVDDGGVGPGDGLDDGATDDGSDAGWVDDGTGALNPEIYYMSGGPAPEMDHRSNLLRGASHSTRTMRQSEDLCVTPAQGLVWLCELVNGKSD